MQKTLIVILAVALLAGAAGAANAGPRGGKGMQQGQSPRLAHMQQSLGLSDEQVSRIREIRANGGGRDQVHAVLSEEQRALLDEQRAARRAQRDADGRGGRRKGGDGQRRGAAEAEPAEPGTP